MGQIDVKNLGKAYRQYSHRWARLAEWVIPGKQVRHRLKWIIKDINFQVSPGEAVAIVGVNGAGKSTLLKIITGTTQPTTGSVNMQGRVAALLELGMGFHPDFTGRQNVIMAGQLLGIGLDELTSLLPSIEAFAEIGDYIDQPVRVYSSGMQVRLAFAIATALRPDILIVDEALSVGDAYFQHKCFARIRDFQAQGTTLLFVSHDLAAIRGLCSCAVWIDQGSVRKIGETKAVLDAYATAIYAKEQNIDAAEETARVAAHPPQIVQPRDFRQDFLNNSNLRNDIQVLEFGKDAVHWGDGKAKITSTKLADPSGRPFSWTVGGEDVVLVIEAEALQSLQDVFMGFQVRDRLGQILFGDNTYLSTMDAPIDFKVGTRFQCSFQFLMPILPPGRYEVTAAIVSGTQKSHVVHEWINDALFFESHNGMAVSGLVGVPMRAIDIGSIT